MSTPVVSQIPHDRTSFPPPPAPWATDALPETLRRACARIGPSWPLDRFIAVNPLWELVDLPLREAAARLRSLWGAQLLMPRAWYREAYRRGSLRDEHLRSALLVSGSTETLESLRSLLDEDDPAVSARLQVVDVVDATRDLRHEPSWRGFVTQNVSQFCAAYFDDGQATFGPDREGGLYASWRRQALSDRGPALLMGASAYRKCARDLPEGAQELIALALADLAVDPGERENYLWSLLLDVNGWASWCAYRRWTARLEGGDDDPLPELLAMRLAWEWMLYRLGGGEIAQGWNAAMANWRRLDAAAAAARPNDWLLQAAVEIAWREPVLRTILAGCRVARPEDATVQAVFCIDVRSEVFRRALEATAPTVQTLGFAGFFGLPIEYRPLGAAAARPQLPGLLAPRLRAGDSGVGLEATARRGRRLALDSAWRSFKADALSTFTFVEALGVTYLAKLFQASLGRGGRYGLSTESDARAKPRLLGSVEGDPIDADARCELALGILRGMSLTRHFARLVLLVGHGSTTCNNPHAAGLDCGACCGQSGEVNARAAAALLNDPAVRAGLAQDRVALPESTRFLAALHDTTTDEVELFDLDELPESHHTDLATLRSWLAEAGDRARSERAGPLGLDGVDPVELRRAVKRRARDWSQTRAEWGLANNAALIVAPRERCRHLDLEGRSFLHEYRHEEDEGYAVLEQIMTAPMVVTHWINFQYYASTVDPVRWGSGNKVLHNVVGGHLGVFEGNGGDLRIGLPLQSLHDGTRWVHEPLRLSVFLEAPRAAIDAVLAKHPKVRDLVANEWLTLFQIDEKEGALYALRAGRWHREVESCGP